MKPLVIGVHGFNSDGAYIKDLAPYFRDSGFEYVPFIYGKAAHTTLGNIIANRWRTRETFNLLAQLVINSHAQEIILVGHSHGFRLAWGVQQICGNVVGVVGINGCLDRDTVFRTWVVNAYHPEDWVLHWGARLRPFSRWGDYGYKRQPLAESNINLSQWYSENPHSGFTDHLDEVMTVIVNETKRLYSLFSGVTT